MLSVDEAMAQLLAAAVPTTQVQQRALADACGCVLAEDLCAAIDVPPFDNSAMDGYAMRWADLQNDAQLPVTMRVPAGVAPEALPPGQAARIFTGGVVPAGADTVVMQENCERDGDQLRVVEMPELAANIRRRGEDIGAGQLVIAAGTRLRASHIGLAASLGESYLQVYRPLKIALLTTGDELVEAGQPLSPGRIYNSNRPMLSSLFTEADFELLDLGIVADDLTSTTEALRRASEEADCVISSGGVSVGEEDHVRQAVESLGVINLWRLAIKPGKPLAFGHVEQTPFFGLPGNPVSSAVTFSLLVRPYLLKMQGAQEVLPKSYSLPLGFDLQHKGKRREYLRVGLAEQDGRKCVLPYPHQGSGVLSSVAWADGLVAAEPGCQWQRGDWVDFIPLIELGL